MASPYAFHQAPPPNLRRGVSPAAPPALSRAASRTPPPPNGGYNRYNPALYSAAANAAGPNSRRPSASPMRTQGEDGNGGGQYNPQTFGRLAGNGGAFVPRQQDEEAPPPPYSPHVSPPHRRQPSCPTNSTTLPENVSQQPTPSTATTQRSFSPYQAGSSTSTTPLTPNDASNWSSVARQRGYSPPSGIGAYAPSSVLRQISFPEGGALPPPSASRAPSAPAQLRSRSIDHNIPPPPPGPPPAASRSMSASAPAASSAARSESLPRGSIPPPPPGPPPRSESQSRIHQLMQRTRSINTPSRLGMASRVATPEMPPLPPPPVIPPKRKTMETHQDSGRHRASPRHEEERERQKGEDNNPWRKAMGSPRQPPSLAGSPRALPPQLSPRNIEVIKERNGALISPSVEPSPTVTVYRDSIIRRKPVSPVLITQNLVRAPQLPTPPPQQPSPISPGNVAGQGIYSDPNDNGEGPSKKDTGKEPAEPEDFIHQTRRRYKEMLRAEATASTEADKLRVFLDFLQQECRLRTPLYASADSADLARLSRVSSAIAGPSLEDSMNLTPISPVVNMQQEDEDGDVDMSLPPQGQVQKTPRQETQWWGQNLTATFPPQSAMSAYEARVAEEESSRGRTSSRWWETSGEGGSCSISENVALRSDDNDSVYGSSYPRRSRRFNKTPRQSLREIAELVTSPRNSAQTPVDPNDPTGYMHSVAFPPDHKPRSMSRSKSRAPSSSRPRVRRRQTVKTSLDIAPLLTLLPGWPREYPAINNSHPRLDVFRDLVRTLNDLSPLSSLQTRFAEKTKESKELFGADSQRRRISQAERIQGLYSRGDLHYDEMERLNIDFEHEEGKIQHEAEEEEFKSFDVEVVTPAHRDLHERITAATAAYGDLTTLIKARNPIATDSEQEQQPELLEYLTALKWIFDVRETLHQHVFDMLAERNERYKALILRPLRDARDQGPLHSTVAFFAQDSAARLADFHASKVLRHEQFMDVVESQVTRGVEVVRSKFWEIAPLVMECCEKIPGELENVVPIVPPEEYVDHPEWVECPMRYLQCKITEAEGAMRALGLEEGEGLLCLLHGVKTALARANARGGDDGGREERRLTEDLKEKVGMIEDEWREGLGGILEKVRKNVDSEMEKAQLGRSER